MLRNYLQFLSELMMLLEKYFNAQQPYMFCQKGCAKCCQNGDYPFTEIEVDLLKVGFANLNNELKIQILNKISKLKEEKDNCETEFTYECPFLINNMCSVYNHRGIICRTFGLIYQKKNAKMQIPFCAYEGLNYSNILDKETGMLSSQKMKEQGITTEPTAYNIHYSFLTSEDIEKTYGFKFGKKGSLIDLLDIDNLS